ncbi:MAG: cation transporter [Alphaproteobacteria bacterium]|nr:cation transporter [Alphaproteobacteria bacterium]
MFDHSQHHHHHPHQDHSKAFVWGIGLNCAFIIAEVIYGLQANSLALLADAGHNASDVIGLFLAWGAMLLAKRQPSERYTYGLQSSSILAALANSTLLMLAVGGIGLEAIQRFSSGEAVAGGTVMAVAGFGVLINALTAWFFMRSGKGDLNIRGAFLHMVADALISLGVVISGLVIMNTGWLWLDPLVSLLIALAIIVGTWSLLRDSINLALQAVPRNIDPAEVKSFLAGLEGVKEVHDLHIWAMSTSETAMTVHLLMPAGHPGDAFIWRAVNALAEKFTITHVTIQIELGDCGEECALTHDTHGHNPEHSHAYGHHH